MPNSPTLSGQQILKVREAILGGFNYNELSDLMLFEFDVQLEHMAKGSLQQVVESVVDWSVRKGYTRRLIEAMGRSNPGNPQVKELVRDADSWFAPDGQLIPTQAAEAQSKPSGAPPPPTSSARVSNWGKWLIPVLILVVLILAALAGRWLLGDAVGGAGQTMGLVNSPAASTAPAVPRATATGDTKPSDIATADFLAAIADTYINAGQTADAGAQAAQRVAALGEDLPNKFSQAISFYQAQPDRAASVANLITLAEALGIPVPPAPGTADVQDTPPPPPGSIADAGPPLYASWPKSRVVFEDVTYEILDVQAARVNPIQANSVQTSLLLRLRVLNHTQDAISPYAEQMLLGADEVTVPPLNDGVGCAIVVLSQSARDDCTVQFLIDSTTPSMELTLRRGDAKQVVPLLFR